MDKQTKEERDKERAANEEMNDLIRSQHAQRRSRWRERLWPTEKIDDEREDER